MSELKRGRYFRSTWYDKGLRLAHATVGAALTFFLRLLPHGEELYEHTSPNKPTLGKTKMKRNERFRGLTVGALW